MWRISKKIHFQKQIFLPFVLSLTILIFFFIIIKLMNQYYSPNNTSKIEADSIQTEEYKPGKATPIHYNGANSRTGWIKTSSGSRYFPKTDTYYSNGWKKIDNSTYYFDQNGYILTGWNNIEGITFFFDSEGKLHPQKTPKFVALTYDDGVSNYTNHLLDYFEESNIKATFFIIGNLAEQHEDIIKRMDSMGMEIGSHTYEHSVLTKLSPKEIQETMNKTDMVLHNIIGRGASLMRAVGGSVNDTVKSHVKQPIIGWSVDTNDWQNQNVHLIVECIKQNVTDGSIILMHDLYPSTVEATKLIVPWLEEQGYHLLTISELAKARGITLESGAVYKSFPKTH